MTTLLCPASQPPAGGEGDESVRIGACDWCGRPDCWHDCDPPPEVDLQAPTVIDDSPLTDEEREATRRAHRGLRTDPPDILEAGYEQW